MADNEYDPDEALPVADTRPRLETTLPRAALEPFDTWAQAGFIAQDGGTDPDQLTVTMPPGWERRATATEGIDLLWDGFGRARFLATADELAPVTEEDAVRY